MSPTAIYFHSFLVNKIICYLGREQSAIYPFLG